MQMTQVMSYYQSMEHILERASVIRAAEAMKSLGVQGSIVALSESARTAQEAADALGVEVGQIASSLIFKLPSGGALLIVTSGRHRVDTDLVAKNLGIEKLGRVDADFVKEISGYSIGGVSPLGWISKPEVILIDKALNDYEVVWAAAGHPHAVYPTSYTELLACIKATPMIVGD
jgi:prolyl-tRNA editing enzyme YbaK/EbsC (Cys-tRNA(Pro) deacylase)